MHSDRNEAAEPAMRTVHPVTDLGDRRFHDVAAWRALAALAFAASASGLPPGVGTTIGVTLGLVTSGFVLGLPFAVAQFRGERLALDVRTYALKRALRVTPALATALIAYAVAGRAGAAPVAGSHVLAEAVARFAIAYAAFPLLAFLARRPAAFALLALTFAAAATLAPFEAWIADTIVPFMLGMVAANVRVCRPKQAAYACAVIPAAVAAAVASHGRLDPVPFVALASCGALAATGAVPIVARALGAWPLRVLGAAAFAASLAWLPAVAAAMRGGARPAVAAGVAAIATVLLWQCVDRWFADGRARTHALAALRARGQRHEAGTAPHGADAPAAPQAFAEPPVLATAWRRSGSAAELAAEIFETRRRLRDHAERARPRVRALIGPGNGVS